MAIPVLIIGKSGSGKSASLRNFRDEDISIINVEGKPLPFRNAFKDVIHTDSYRAIAETMKKSKKKVIVIDDAGYLITNSFMREHSAAGAGNSIFALYNSLADNFWRLIEYIKKLPPDRIVYVIMHEDKSDSGDIKPKTIGKLLDEKVCIEGMFTIVLRSLKKDGGYYFVTQTDGLDVTKTPIGMFEDEMIDNDLKKVDDTIRSYYGMTDAKGKAEEDK